MLTRTTAGGEPVRIEGTVRVKPSQRIVGFAQRWLIAVWAVAAAFALTLMLTPLIEPGISPFFLVAVMISAWRGGLGVGLLATVLSALASAFVFLPPRYSMDIDHGDLLQLGVFTFAAVIVGTLSAARKKAQMEREVLLTKEQAARLEAERANRVKDEFLAAVSHELRTPLTTIKTLTRLMQRREMTEEERAEYLEDLAAECDREIDLVLNLLDVSRMRAGGMKIEPSRVDVAETVRACAMLVRGEAERLHHRLRVDVPEELPPARADASALRRALCAIAENSVKFTPSGGEITLRAGLEGERIFITVQDTGRGIAPEDLPNIFRKFYRGTNAGWENATAEDVPGIGLGLHLAQNLIEGMGGTIEVESEPGEGSEFIVMVPVWEELVESQSKLPAAVAEAVSAARVHVSRGSTDG